MSTVHNPVNFNPADYQVLGYFDNQPPKFFPRWDALAEDGTFIPGAADRHQEEVAAWARRRDALFTGGLCRKCVHCGNGSVRYVCSALHIPSGNKVCFGDVCCEQLQLPSRSAYEAEKVRELAAGGKKRLRVALIRDKFLTYNPHVLILIMQSKKAVHQNNQFAKDVLGNLDKYGTLSAWQIQCVGASFVRDTAYFNRKKEEAENPPVEPAPTGRVTVEGVIVSTRVDTGPYGSTVKMLVKLANRCKVWCTMPASCNASKGEQIKFTATFTRSDNDQFFSFGKRPHLTT